MKKRKLITSLAMMMIFTSLFAQQPYKAAHVYSNHQVVYGKFIIRMKMIKGSGMLSAFSTTKPDSYLPEVFWEQIDFTVLGRGDATIVSPAILTDGVSGALKIDHEEFYNDNSLADEYHTYTLEWTPDSIVWYVDSKVIRLETDTVVHSLISPSNYIFSTGISCDVSRAGILDPGTLPQYLKVDWIEYHKYNNGKFAFAWRDDFVAFDTTVWIKANTETGCNDAEFAEENVYIEDGKLVLAITDPNPPETATALNTSNTSDFFKIVKMSSSRELQVKLFENGNYKFRLFNLQGKAILINEINGESINLSYAGLKSGIYFLNVQSKDNSVTKKIYIE